MKPLTVAVITLAIVAALVASWLGSRETAPPDSSPPASANGAPAADRGAPVDVDIPEADAAEAERDRVLDAYYEPLRFRDAITAFIDGAPARSTAENLERAAELSRRIRRYHETGYLALPQARYLEGTIVSAVYRDDDAARRQALEDLRAEYAARAEAPSTDHLDERFEAYKRREAEIVREVMTADPPAGMTRDEWLRERLDALRSEVYGGE